MRREVVVEVSGQRSVVAISFITGVVSLAERFLLILSLVRTVVDCLAEFAAYFGEFGFADSG